MPRLDPKLMQRAAVTTGVLLAGLWVVPTATTILTAHWETAMARQDVKDWVAGRVSWTPEAWQEANRSLAAGIHLTPLDPALHESMASLYSMRGLAEWGDGQEGSAGIVHYREAVKHQRQAAELRPLHPYAWANLAYFQYGANATAEQIFGPWELARARGPNEAEMQAGLMNVARMAWSLAPAQVRNWVDQKAPGAAAQFDQEQVDLEAAYEAEQQKARAQSEAVANAARVEQERQAEAERAQRNAQSPAFKSLFGTPEQVHLPK